MYTIGELAEIFFYLCPKPYPKVLTHHQMLFNTTVNNLHIPVKPDSPLKPETAYYPPQYSWLGDFSRMDAQLPCAG